MGITVLVGIVVVIAIIGGLYLHKSKRKGADEWFTEAAKAEERGDYEQAVELYTKASDEGHVVARSCLGILYLSKESHYNLDEAEKWFELASESKGSVYAERKAVTLSKDALTTIWNIRGKEAEAAGDLKAALGWFIKAAEAGNGLAQNYVGEYYIEGKGVEPDRKKARQWFERAAEKGSEEAEESLKRYYIYGAHTSAPKMKKNEIIARAGGKNPGSLVDIDWIGEAPGKVGELDNLEAMNAYQPNLGYGYYLTHYICPVCGKLLYKIKSKGAVGSYLGEEFPMYNIFTCPECTTFYTSQVGEDGDPVKLSRKALMSRVYGVQYEGEVAYTSQFRNDG